MKRILDLLGWLGVVLVGVALGIRLGPLARLPGINGPNADTYARYLAYGGLVCVLLYTASQWREIAASFKRRQTRYGALMTVSVVVVLGILVAVNYLSARQNKRWDLTANQQFTLSDQSIQLLRKLDAPVKFLVFDQEVNFDRFRSRLNEYEYHSGNVKTEYIDADKKPVQTKQYEIQRYGTVVVEYKGRRERVTSDTEQDLTNALIKVITGQQKKVYFVSGHGEKSQAGSERDGYSTINAALGRDNYAVDSLVLAQQKEVPADASVLVVAGPKTDLLQGEADMLRRYLAKGGHVFLLLDPPDAQSGAKPIVEGLVKEWGIDPGQNIVVDVSGMGQLIGTDATVPVAATYPQHPITEPLNMITAYPLARSVTPIAGGANGHTAQSIIETSPRSWAESDLKLLSSGGEVAMDEKQGDKPGPISVGAAVSAAATETAAAPADAAKNGDDIKKPESRMVVIGDSDFVANFAIGIPGNRDLFMNAVNWLAQQENLISIRAKEPDDRRITLTAEQETWIRIMAVLLIPAAVLGAGVLTWSRRRK